MRTTTDILCLYFYREPFGPTVMDHLESFERYSSFQVTSLNLAATGATDRLRRMDAGAIVLHYTLFGMQYYLITEEQAWIVRESPAIKIAFFQDEYHQPPKRFRFIEEYGVDVIYTLLEPQHFRDTYYARTKAPVVLQTLAGYVSDHLLETSDAVRREGTFRDIDVGYRGHELDITYGLAGQEKRIIGQEFKRLTAHLNLKLDVETSVDRRIYGPEWYRFMARCRAMLGVEAGVSAFDMEDAVRLGARRLRHENPGIDDKELWEAVVRPWEDVVPYRMISPRHLEAAALGTTQILFTGAYTGLMDPWTHYIPLTKDFSNLDEVLGLLNDQKTLENIASNARRDLIDSGYYHYREFVAGVDQQLRLMGLKRLERRGRL